MFYASDSKASGNGRGEGMRTPPLKPLHDAIRDGNPVQVVVKDAAVNQDNNIQTITSPDNYIPES